MYSETKNVDVDKLIFLILNQSVICIRLLWFMIMNISDMIFLYNKKLQTNKYKCNINAV